MVEVFSCEALVETSSIAEARVKSKARIEDKEHVMQDGKA